MLARVSSVIGTTDAPVAWLQIRPALPKVDKPELDVIFDTQHKEAVVTSNLKGAAVAMRHGRPLRVFSIAEDVREIRRAFRRVAAAG